MSTGENTEKTEEKAGEKVGEKAEEKAKNPGREIASMLMYMAFILVLTFFVVRYVGQRTQVDGQSMESTLYDGDNLIVDKITYRFRDP